MGHPREDGATRHVRECVRQKHWQPRRRMTPPDIGARREMRERAGGAGGPKAHLIGTAQECQDIGVNVADVCQSKHRRTQEQRRRDRPAGPVNEEREEEPSKEQFLRKRTEDATRDNEVRLED